MLFFHHWTASQVFSSSRRVSPLSSAVAKKDLVGPQKANEVTDASSHLQMQKLICKGQILHEPVTAQAQSQCWTTRGASEGWQKATGKQKSTAVLECKEGNPSREM